jgi:hypothetical protein
MTPKQWRQIEDLYHAAQKSGPNDRAALLECTDPEIRFRVQRMLALALDLSTHTPASSEYGSIGLSTWHFGF